MIGVDDATLKGGSVDGREDAPRRTGEREDKTCRDVWTRSAELKISGKTLGRCGELPTRRRTPARVVEEQTLCCRRLDVQRVPRAEKGVAEKGAPQSRRGA